MHSKIDNVTILNVFVVKHVRHYTGSNIPNSVIDLCNRQMAKSRYFTNVVLSITENPGCESTARGGADAGSDQQLQLSNRGEWVKYQNTIQCGLPKGHGDN